jgi:hypothetical protein
MVPRHIGKVHQGEVTAGMVAIRGAYLVQSQRDGTREPAQRVAYLVWSQGNRTGEPAQRVGCLVWSQGNRTRELAQTTEACSSSTLGVAVALVALALPSPRAHLGDS